MLLLEIFWNTLLNAADGLYMLYQVSGHAIFESLLQPFMGDICPLIKGLAGVLPDLILPDHHQYGEHTYTSKPSVLRKAYSGYHQQGSVSPVWQPLHSIDMRAWVTTGG